MTRVEYLREYDYFAEYDDLITNSLEKYHVAGLSIAIIDGDSTQSTSYGISRLPDKKVTPSTLFNAASMTKAQIAACISILIDERSDIEWTTPVSELLRDDFVLADHHYTANVTVEDMLSHRSGLPEYDESPLLASGTS